MSDPIRNNLFDLSGKTALVTGAASGLGRVFAEALGAYGAAVICGDVETAGNRETAERIAAVGGNARAVALDVADPASVDAVTADIEATEGRLDILVNNAGIATGKQRVHEMSIENWDRLMAVNLRGVFLCMRATLPLMLERRGGSIINISSVAGLVGVDPEIPAVASNYSAAKAGVIGLTREAAAEYGPHNIRVNAIAPGWHLGTNLGRDEIADASPEMMQAFLNRLQQDTPLRRTGDPAELAGLVVYLASDAASFLTGQVIAHDGGWTVT